MELKHLIAKIFNVNDIKVTSKDIWSISHSRNVDERCLKVGWLILKFSYTNYYLELKICICKWNINNSDEN